MAATMQAILSSFIILVVALVDAHENPHHAHNHAVEAHPHHATTLPHAHDQHAHTHHATGHGHTPHAHHTQPVTGQGAARHGRKSAPWKDAHATFYGSPDGTLGGACGYEEKDKEIYGKDTTALSTALFDNGTTCGACFEIKCDETSQWCKPGQPTVIVTATDFCPPGGSGWCDSPKEHFDLSQPAFLKIAEYKAGIVPIKYRRCQCKRQGGIRYTVTGNPYFNMVGITNVGGAGDVVKVEVKVGEQWTTLAHNYGDKWDTNAKLVGAKLTFRITTSDGKSIITEQAAPENWQFGQTYQGNQMA